MEEDQDINKTSTQLIVYRLDELKTNVTGLKTEITTLATEVRTLGGSGCFVGKENKKEIGLIKEEIIELKKRPRETIIFAGVCLAILLAIGGVMVYLHETLPNKNIPVATIGK
jgi:hypothetical protein